MELERSREGFLAQGMTVAAISYDSPELLRAFARRAGVQYPLLSDPDSAVIRAFGILNPNFPVGHPWHGVPFPGTYVVDASGTVLAKYFEEGHRQRSTADTILVKQFRSGGGRRTAVETPHLKLQAYTSQDSVRPGNRIAIALEIEFPEGMHVYAEGAGRYRPLRLTIAEDPALLVHAPELPAPETLHLPAIDETVPVYRGTLRLSRDVTVSPRLRQPSLEIRGVLDYQACDDRRCYAPVAVPLSFTLGIESHDSQRAPEALRRPEPR